MPDRVLRLSVCKFFPHGNSCGIDTNIITSVLHMRKLKLTGRLSNLPLRTSG